MFTNISKVKTALRQRKSKPMAVYSDNFDARSFAESVGGTLVRAFMNSDVVQVIDGKTLDSVDDIIVGYAENQPPHAVIFFPRSMEDQHDRAKFGAAHVIRTPGRQQVVDNDAIIADLQALPTPLPNGTYAQLAKKYSVSRERVRQIAAKINMAPMRKKRNPVVKAEPTEAVVLVDPSRVSTARQKRVGIRQGRARNG